MRRLGDPVAAACLAGVALLAGWQMFAPPVVGLADNGDDQKVAGAVGLSHRNEVPEPERYFGFLQTKFAYVRPHWAPTGYLTSERPLARLAWILGKVFAPQRLFDIRILGAIHLSLLLAGIWLIVRATRGLPAPVRWVAGAMLVLVFTDVGYIECFNSFYSQNASLLFLLTTAGLAGIAVSREEPPSATLVAALAISATLFACSKPQESIEGLLLAAALPFAARVREGNPARRARIRMTALAMAVVAVLYAARTPRWLREATLYDTVFFGLLLHSPEPSRDLRALGLDPGLARFVGTNAYSPASPMQDRRFRDEFFRKTSHLRVAGFYLLHPSRLLALASRGAAIAAFANRTRSLGNFEKSAGLPPGAVSGACAVWSRAKASLTRESFPFLAIFLLLNAGIALRSRRQAPSARSRLAWGLLALLPAMAAVDFFTCLLAEDVTDLARHLYAFKAIVDLCFVLDAGALALLALRLSARLTSGARQKA